MFWRSLASIPVDADWQILYLFAISKNIAEKMRARTFILLFMIGLLSGCGSWFAQPIERSPIKKVSETFQRLRMSPDTVVLEIAVAKIDLADMEKFERLWRRLDTSSIPLAHRKSLDQNGFRVALCSSHVPAELHEILEPTPIDESTLSSWQIQLFKKGLLKPLSKFLLHDGIQNRRGEVHPVPVSDSFEEASWVLRQGDRTTVGAGTNVRAVIEVKTYPKGDGTVRLVCTPTLHLGDARRQIGVSQQNFAYETAQDKRRLSDLVFEACLRSGESMLVAPTSDLGDLGGLFFGLGPQATVSDGGADSGTFRVLMVRLLQTQMDDLFKSQSVAEKLTTTSID